MYCNNCGKLNPKNSNYCEYCGAKLAVHIVEDASNSDLQINGSISTNNPPYPYVISLWKFFILSILTFGIYEFYWFYKQWKSFYAVNNQKHGWFILLLVSIFSGFSSFWLFKIIAKDLKEVDASRKLKATLLATAYLIISALGRLQGNYWMLAELSIFALLPVQNIINYYWSKKYGDKIQKSNFGLGSAFVVVLGLLLMITVIKGAFYTNNSTDFKTNYKTSFVKSCTDPAKGATASYCTCVADKLINKYTDSQLTSISNKYSSTGKTPQELNSAINECISTKNDTTSPVNSAQSVVNIACDNNEGGSGTIMTKDGLILTNNHVITGASTCLVSLPDPQTGAPTEIYTAQPLVVPNLSQLYDIAVVQVTGSYVDSNRKIWGVYPTIFPAYQSPNTCSKITPQLGDPITIYGYPVTSGGSNLTITQGIISSFSDNGNILTSAQVDSGNSGGLAVNSKTGCMVGIPSAVEEGNYQNLGVIIPTSVIADFIEKATTQKLSLQAPEVNNTTDQEQIVQTASDQQSAPSPSESQIDCTGPDGKHFQTTQEECDTFNAAWAPTPTPNPNGFWGF